MGRCVVFLCFLIICVRLMLFMLGNWMFSISMVNLLVISVCSVWLVDIVCMM